MDLLVRGSGRRAGSGRVQNGRVVREVLYSSPATTARCHGGGCSGWEVDQEAGSAGWGAEQLHGSGEGVDAAGEAGQPRAVRVGDAVVSHSQGKELPRCSIEMSMTVTFACFARASPTMY
jgi:hypothetical protein